MLHLIIFFILDLISWCDKGQSLMFIWRRHFDNIRGHFHHVTFSVATIEPVIINRRLEGILRQFIRSVLVETLTGSIHSHTSILIFRMSESDVPGQLISQIRVTPVIQIVRQWSVVKAEVA